MNILTITKGIVGAAASFGSGAVVSNAIKATTPTDISRYQKLAVGIGGFAISALVGDAVTRMSDKKVDEAADIFGVPKDADIEVDVSMKED